MSLNGVELLLRKRVDQSLPNATLLRRAMELQLGSIEEERLRLLVQLQEARRDVDDYRAQVQQEANQRSRKEAERCRREAEEAIAALHQLQQQLNQLADEQQEGQGNVLIPHSGDDMPEEKVLAHCVDAFTRGGRTISRNTAIALMTLMAARHRVGIVCEQADVVAQRLSAFCRRMGWGRALSEPLPAEETAKLPKAAPMLLIRRQLSAEPASLPPTMVEVLVTAAIEEQTGNDAYLRNPWPILTITPIDRKVIDTEPASEPPEELPPTAASLDSFLTGNRLSEEDVLPLLRPLLDAAELPVDSPAWKDMCGFLLACAERMDGGLPTACDWTAMLWLVPRLKRQGAPAEDVAELLEALPSAASLWNLL